MKILVSSHRYDPSIGGIESVTAILTREWIAAGHEVRIVTKTDAPSDENNPITVIRNPSLRRLFSEIVWSDLYFQNNISLQTLWPALILGKITLITHQTWFSRGISGFVKKLACSLVRCTVAISEAVRRESSADFVIPNPYQANVFFEEPDSQKDGDLIFVGRLVSDKGADLLIEALRLLAQRDIHPSLTIVGEGPESAPLRDLVKQSNLEKQIVFLGNKDAIRLAELLRRHRILIVPSRWKEPFGIVALEGIACGCVVVGSGGGGLSEAIGPCGLLFQNGDLGKLADQLQKLLGEGTSLLKFTDPNLRERHLDRHSPALIAAEYQKLFMELLGQDVSPLSDLTRP